MATTNKFKDRFIALLSKDSIYKPTDPELLEKLNIKGALSYNDIGQKIGVSAQAIDNWINNRANPKTSNVEKIAALFGVSTSWLLGYEDAVVSEDTETYNYFKKYGFSYKAFSNLKRIKDLYSSDPNTADRVIKDYMYGINIILENIFLSNGNSGSKCIKLLNDFLGLSYTHIIEVDTTEIEHLQFQLEDDDCKDKNPKEIINEYFEMLLDTKLTFDPIKTDLSNLAKLSEELKKIKLRNAKQELLKLICNATQNSNADVSTDLTDEQLQNLSSDDRKVYHDLRKVYNFYSE